jgi:predicted nucleotidyltransferase
MLTPSSDSAKVTFVDAMAIVHRLRAAAQLACAQNPNITTVILFGSLATGGATPASDADLLVIIRDDARRVLDRIPDYSPPFERVGVAVQLLPWTEAEVASRLREGDRFAREILDTGVTLAGSVQPHLLEWERGQGG